MRTEDEDYELSQFMRAFGQIANAFDGGGDRGTLFPQSDVDDFGNGARFIPGEVTLVRRDGQRVPFVQACGPCCWYWQLPSGDRVYHWVRYVYERIGQENGRTLDPQTEGFPDGAGPCPACGNPFTSGGTIPAAQIAAPKGGQS